MFMVNGQSSRMESSTLFILWIFEDEIYEKKFYFKVDLGRLEKI